MSQHARHPGLQPDPCWTGPGTGELLGELGSHLCPASRPVEPGPLGTGHSPASSQASTWFHFCPLLPVLRLPAPEYLPRITPPGVFNPVPEPTLKSVCRHCKLSSGGITPI